MFTPRSMSTEKALYKCNIKINSLFSVEDAIPTGGGVSFNVDFKPVKKSKRRRKIKKRAQTPMKPKVEDKEDVRYVVHICLSIRPSTFSIAKSKRHTVKPV